MNDIASSAPIDHQLLHRIISAALEEDVGMGDITSMVTLPSETRAKLDFVARKPMVLCGGFIPAKVYEQLGNVVSVECLKAEGAMLQAGDIIARACGSVKLLLTGERVALNFMQRMSGVATLAHAYVQAVEGTRAVILDTRKTMPGLRMLDKYAVKCGGASNHRMGLWDMILIKDNHIAACGSIALAVKKARAASTLPIEVECDTLQQLQEALAVKPERILLDNMDVAQLSAAVKMAKGAVALEASGGVSLHNIHEIAQTGVDYISVGALTHSAVAADIAADLQTL